ncbi:MAG: hypothetical protein ACRC4L_01000 [Mycoplasma sp.]
MQTQLSNVSKQMPRNTIVNSIIGILLALTMIIFNLIRTGLTTKAFGVDSLGLLTIVVGILPYITSGHSGLSSISTSRLYNSVHLKNYSEANQEISNIKPQYYFFGFFYLMLTILIAFCFPFIISGNGVIHIEDTHTNIQWYESTLFILANAVELFSSYFIIPVSVILLFISKKSYIVNLYSIIFTILLNGIIFLIFGLVINNVIDLSFIQMNIIIFSILGTKMFFVLFCLYFYRRKLFGWYKKQKPSSYVLKKDTLRAVASQYLNQFGTDIIAVLFMVYAIVNPLDQHSPEVFDNIETYHAGDNHGANTASNFVPSAIYSTYLMLLVSAREIVHSIIDAAIPSVAEHATYNDKNISKHMFHRYQVLTLFIAIFTTSTYIFIGGIAQSLFLHDMSHGNGINNHINIYLISLLWLPIIIDIFSDMYKHLLPIFKEFKLLFRVSLYKSISNTIILSIISLILFFTTEGVFLMNGIFITIICSSIISNFISYIILKKYIDKRITKDSCVDITKSSILSLGWIFISIIIMLPIYLIFQEDLSHIIDLIGIYGVIGISVAILLLNFFLSLFWIWIFRRDDFNFYYKNAFKESSDILIAE